ncbi:MAG: hypothetical protein HXY18_13760 [Bryobacteraceae bacterium]|nr:hypothetical protein [Bryobacteraceae bacterium]
MKVEVECYSGYKLDERPLRFSLKGRVFEVLEVLDRWYGPRDIYFKVRATGGGAYILRRNEARGEVEWTLEAYRAEPA